MKTILLATDFSLAATNAAKFALEMALKIKADLLLFHAYQATDYYSEIPLALKVEDIKQDNADKSIAKLKEQLYIESGSKIHIETLVKSGGFFFELNNLCKQINPYVVIMGSQGTTAAERLLFGGHTIYAMKHLKWPIITVPLGISYHHIKKIGLVCSFDNPVNDIPIDKTKILLDDFKAELHVLINNKEKFDQEIVFESGILHETLISLKPHYHYIAKNKNKDGIIEFAEKNHFDLLIIQPGNHGFMENLIFKSHTKEMVLHSHIPILALHS